MGARGRPRSEVPAVAAAELADLAEARAVLAQQQEALDAQLLDVMERALEAGAPLESIGEIVGLSKQGVQYRIRSAAARRRKADELAEAQV